MATTDDDRIRVLEAKLAAAETIIADLRPDISGGTVDLRGLPFGYSYLQCPECEEIREESEDLVTICDAFVVNAYRDWVRLGGRTR